MQPTPLNSNKKIREDFLSNSAGCRIWRTDRVCLCPEEMVELTVVELSGAGCNGNVFPLMAEIALV